jgi:hypothetical protein
MIVLVVRHVVAGGTAIKHVQCERCRREFDYALSRSVALDTLPLPWLVRSAERICGERLRRRLAEDVEPVSCPSCGWMQSHMIPALRRQFLRPLRSLGASFAYAGGALSILMLSLAVLFTFVSTDLDINWLGIAGAGAGAGALGLLLVWFRSQLGRIRYGKSGFATKSSRGARFLVISRAAA